MHIFVFKLEPLKTYFNNILNAFFKRNSILFVIVFGIAVSCISRYNDLDYQTETEIVFPVLRGTYTLGDLFYGFDEVTDITLEPGIFFSFSDTIPFELSLQNNWMKHVELIFRSVNIMPFQVDLVVTPFDSVTSTVTGEPLFVTLVEAAWVESDGLSLQPVNSENTMIIKDIVLNELIFSNSIILDLNFIWPYEKISTTMFDDYSSMYAFQLLMILKIKP